MDCTRSCTGSSSSKTSWRLHEDSSPPQRTRGTRRNNPGCQAVFPSVSSVSSVVETVETMTAHDDEILGKAYDARLMRRLAQYLRPYRRQVALSFVAIIVGAAAQLAQPYLMKVAIDRY